jgi:hypothetical protein
MGEAMIMCPVRLASANHLQDSSGMTTRNALTMSEPLKADDFLPYVGKNFAAKDGRHALVLTRVEQPRLGDRGNFRDPFILIFRGPPGDVLPEGLYTFEVEGGPSFEFHVMPIHTPARDRQDYQAAFN